MQTNDMETNQAEQVVQSTITKQHEQKQQLSTNGDSRPPKKKMKSNGSVDRDCENEGGGEESGEDVADIFKDCFQNDGENQNNIMVYLKSLKTGFDEMRAEFRGEVSKMNNKLDTVVENVKSEVKAEISQMRKTVENTLERLDNTEKLLSEVNTRVSRQEETIQSYSTELDECKHLLERYEDKLIDLDAKM